MTATKTRRTAEQSVRPFRVTIDSPLASRISVDVQAENPEAAKELVVGWIRDAMTVETKHGDGG